MRVSLLIAFSLSFVWLATAAKAEGDIPKLIGQLSKDQPKKVRLAAVKCLASAKGAGVVKAVDALVTACKDGDAEIRSEAVRVLGTVLYLNKRQCHLALLEAMNDSDSSVRHEAVTYVGFLVDRLPREAIPMLLALADDRSTDVRSGIMPTLGRAAGKDPIVLAVFKQATHDRSFRVRMNAVAGLWEATDDLPKLVPHWLLLEEPVPQDADDDEKTIRSLAATGVALRFHNFGKTRPAETATILLPLLADDSPVIRRGSAKMLGAMTTDSKDAKRILKKKNVLAAVKKLLDDPDKSVRFSAAVAVERLSK